MKSRIGCLCGFTLVFLLSLLGFATQAVAQDHTFNQLSRPPRLRGKPWKTHKAETADPVSAYSVLYSFCSVVQNAQCSDGQGPVADLIQDAAGNLYGTTYQGGANGQGTVFKLDDTGQETVLYSFCPNGGICTDGAQPYASLIQDAAGNLYGTTLGGGANGFGTVFTVDATGKETVLHSFTGPPDGEVPYAGLIQDAAGNLYGTTSAGGGGANGGMVFRVDDTGHETVLYSFCSASKCTDGASPYARLIQDAAGNLYGTTFEGGVNDLGTVFKIDTTGHETVLNSFCSAANCADGARPYAGLIQDTTGNLYGTTVGGGNPNSSCGNDGVNDGCGTVFKVDNTGQETVLYSFCPASGCADGANPLAGLILDAGGNLYGTTQGGGSGGTVFKLDNAGQEKVLYSFCSASGCTDGETPDAGLIQDAAGKPVRHHP